MTRLILPFVSRRHLLGAGAATALAAPFISRARAAEGSVTFAGYSGIFEENYRAAVIEPFMKANPGIKVTYYTMGNSAQTLGNLRAQKAAPQVDVAIMDVSVAKAATDEGLFAPLDKASMPVLGELSPRAFTKGVNGAAVTFDNLVLLYSPQRVTPAPTSWKVMWDKKYKDQIAFAGAPDIVGLGFTLIADKMFGGIDYRKSVEKGIQAVSEMAPNVLSWDPKPDAYTFITNGTTSLGVGWNARGQLYSSQSDGKLAAVLPSEGSVFQINIMGLVQGGKNTAAAMTFMSYALGAEAQAAFTERMFYAPVNTKAKVSAKAMALTAASPERQALMLDIDWLEVAKIRNAMNEQWRRRILTRR
ncbi:MAG: polyamine ABC transporter substrate-binding protein [Rhodospirillales bacterium 70-18]|nr:ABC transporter substrate-binding protein [Rhodospirillales bacterium]OJY64119.1 MAG: polyamine ABC transporter substrate-binding protein [Rhodospirillales bacterium 70-18]